MFVSDIQTGFAKYVHTNRHTGRSNDLFPPQVTRLCLPLSRRFLHLDTTLALPRPGLAIVCQEAFAEGLPKFLNGWKLINVSADDAEKKLGCNGLVLSKDSIIIGDNLPGLKKELEAEGLEVITTPIDALSWQGGGFRCWHHPLIRLG